MPEQGLPTQGESGDDLDVRDTTSSPKTSGSYCLS